MHNGKAAFSVRGLTLSDLSLLLRSHMPDIQVIVAMRTDYQSAENGDIFPLLTTLAAEAPVLAARIIAHGAGEPSAHENAKLLPLPLQVEALAEIFRLTFEEYGGLEKTVAALGKMAAGFGVTLPRVPPIPEPGLGAKPLDV